jgi:hypothetical protein
LAAGHCGERHEGNSAAADQGAGYRPLGPLCAPRWPGEVAAPASEAQLALRGAGKHPVVVLMDELADAVGV